MRALYQVGRDLETLYGEGSGADATERDRQNSEMIGHGLRAMLWYLVGDDTEPRDNKVHAAAIRLGISEGLARGILTSDD